MIIVLVYLLGIAVGIISAFLGIGGGILIIPTLDILFPVLPRQAIIATCIAIIVVNSVLNLLRFRKVGKWPPSFCSLPLFLGGSAGMLIAGKLAVGFSKSDLKLIFAGILSLIVLRIVFHRAPQPLEKDWNPQSDLNSFLKFAAVGMLGGFVSGMTGLGGGAVLVPAFMVLLNMPASWLSPYSQVAMISGIWGVISYAKLPIEQTILAKVPYSQLVLGHVHFGLVAAVFLGAFTSSKLGVKFNTKASPELKKKVLCFFFIVVILRILIMHQW